MVLCAGLRDRKVSQERDSQLSSVEVDLGEIRWQQKGL